MKRPNFFIIGAPKCGTTSLAHWLGEHPNVYMSRAKEPHFYNTDMTNRNYLSKSAYEALFKHASEQHTAVGEASTFYLYSQQAVPNILHENPAARLIVCLRNPVDMVVSLHGQNRKQLVEDLPRLEDAWEAQQDRACGRRVPRHCREPAALFYARVCALGSQLERLRAVAPRENVRMVFLEDLHEDPGGQYSMLLDFLNLAHDRRTSFPAKNKAGEPRSVVVQKALRSAGKLKTKLGIPLLYTGVMERLYQLNIRPRSALPCDPDFIEQVVRPYFAQEVDLIENLTGRLLKDWKVATPKTAKKTTESNSGNRNGPRV